MPPLVFCAFGAAKAGLGTSEKQNRLTANATTRNLFFGTADFTYPTFGFAIGRF